MSPRPQPYLVLAIDPGVAGAFALIHGGNPTSYPIVEDLPLVRATRGKSAQDVDGRALAAWLAPSANLIRTVVVEAVTSRPRQAGQFAFGVNYGRVLGVLEAIGLTVTHASPQKWKGTLGLMGEDKAMSVRLAAELFPDLKDRLTGPRGGELDGRAEALLLAYYGSRL